MREIEKTGSYSLFLGAVHSTICSCLDASIGSTSSSAQKRVLVGHRKCRNEKERIYEKTGKLTTVCAHLVRLHQQGYKSLFHLRVSLLHPTTSSSNTPLISAKARRNGLRLQTRFVSYSGPGSLSAFTDLSWEFRVA